MSQWQLQMEFLKSDMDRIDNPSYFMKDFQCSEIVKFFGQITSLKQITDKRNQINLFFDRFLSLSQADKTLYVQIKWIMIVHEVIQNLKQNTPLYGYFFKALQVCTQSFLKFQKRQGPYQKYLIKSLVKPYLQYLCKICLLNMPQQTAKYDDKSTHNLETKAEEDGTASADKTDDMDDLDSKLMDWYRKYNFISSTLYTFELILNQVNRYFTFTFPYLSNIGRRIVRDLNIWIFKLKYGYRSLKKSNVTVIELDQLETKIKLFSKYHIDYLESLFQSADSKIQDYTKQEVKQFLDSPLRHSQQLKLFSKKSVQTPLSAIWPR